MIFTIARTAGTASLAALSFALLAGVPVAHAEPVGYTVEPNHTAATWAIPHLGISVIRGRFDKTSGRVSLDRAAKSGTVDITIDTVSVNTGNRKFEDTLRGKDYFNVEQFPTATYKGRVTRFDGDAPAEVEGELTMLGVTRQVALRLNSFRCVTHPLLKREVCGADASASIDRTQFGMVQAVANSSARVDLMLQIEAIRD